LPFKGNLFALNLSRRPGAATEIAGSRKPGAAIKAAGGVDVTFWRPARPAVRVSGLATLRTPQELTDNAR
jgi:hypothetical protein